jgi:hypothetical protein
MPLSGKYQYTTAAAFHPAGKLMDFPYHVQKYIFSLTENAA